MKTFVDVNGKTWEVALTLGSVKRIEDDLGINILDDVHLFGGTDGNSESFCYKMATDAIFAMDVIICVCQESIEKNGYLGIKDDKIALYALMDGDSIGNARKALMSELTDFFQKVGKGKVMETIEIWTKTMETSYEKALLMAELQTRASQEWSKNVKSYLEGGTRDSEKEKALLEELLQTGIQSGDGLDF